MLEVAPAQARYALSLLRGRPFAAWALERLVASARATVAEFGTLGADAAELIAGPRLDDATRREVQLRRFRAVARTAAAETAYYGDLLPGTGLDLRRLTYEQIADVPLTPKSALREQPDAFVRRGSRPTVEAATTGTTGVPARIRFTARELAATGALTALSNLMRGLLGPEDVVLIATSARATLGNGNLVAACDRVGALWLMGGVVDPELSLARLTQRYDLPGRAPRVSVLSTYPSVLGELVEAGLALGLGPEDFGLERIFVGAEVVTEGLRQRARELFGPVRFVEGYAMTEIWPVAALRCSHGHLHFDLAQALVEVVRPDGAAAEPGELGTLVVTPFPPFREATVVLRCDTGDLVTALASATCELAQMQATSDVHGKAAAALPVDGGLVLPRTLREVLEALPCIPLPARFAAQPLDGGVALAVVARRTDALTRRTVEEALRSAGVPVEALTLCATAHELGGGAQPLRCDLRELTFATAPDHEPASDRGLLVAAGAAR